MKPGLLLVAALLVTASVPQQERSFSVAVLRRDGLAVPFAAFDGKRWRSQWPDGIRNEELPISLDDIPNRWWGIDQPPRRMTLWKDGARAGEVALTGITAAPLMCQVRMAVRTDHKSSAGVPPPLERPYPKDGLLVSGDTTVSPIASVEPGSDEGKGALTVIADEFNKKETRAAGAFSGWRHPVKEDARRTTPIRIEALYRAPMDAQGWTAYYVEAVREYPPGREDKERCGPVSFGSGWIFMGPGKRVKVGLSVRVTYCDRFGIGYMLPLGAITAGGRLYWIFQSSSYEAEWYEIVRPTRDKAEPAVAYNAGACL